MVQKKRCSHCRRERLLAAFCRDRNSLDGHKHHCKECQKELRIPERERMLGLDQHEFMGAGCTTGQDGGPCQRCRQALEAAESFTDEDESTRIRRPDISKEYTCDVPGCDFSEDSPQKVGAHKRHNHKDAAKPRGGGGKKRGPYKKRTAKKRRGCRPGKTAAAPQQADFCDVIEARVEGMKLGGCIACPTCGQELP